MCFNWSQDFLIQSGYKLINFVVTIWIRTTNSDWKSWLNDDWNPISVKIRPKLIKSPKLSAWGDRFKKYLNENSNLPFMRRKDIPFKENFSGNYFALYKSSYNFKEYNFPLKKWNSYQVYVLFWVTHKLNVVQSGILWLFANMLSVFCPYVSALNGFNKSTIL